MEIQKKTLLLFGSNIILESFSRSDITNDYLSWLNNPEVVKYSNQRFLHHTRRTAELYMESFKQTQNLFLAVRLKEKNQFIGTMTAYCFPMHQTADIGLMIGDTRYWGKGLGTDAWQTLLNYLLKNNGLRKVTGGTVKRNFGMIRIMKRSGMHLEAVRKKHEIFDKVAEDILYYAKFNFT